MGMAYDVHHPIEVGKRIERLRAAWGGGESQNALAKKLGVSPTRLNNWVVGDNLLPVPYAYKLKLLTGATLDWLYCGDVSSLPKRLSEALALISDAPGE